MFITSNTSTVKKEKEKVVLTSRMTDLELVKINSFVRGYQDCLDIRDATVGKGLILREILR